MSSHHAGIPAPQRPTPPMPAPATVAASLARLLQDARALLGQDQGAALLILDRASRLLDAPPPGTPESEAAGSGTSGGLAQWQVLRLTRYVEARLGRQILLKDLAAEVRLSSGHFARAFKQSFGLTAHSYVMQQRMARAQELMLQTPMPLCEIALTCGLADQAHFSRVFRRLVGASPLAWRRQHRATPRR